MNPFEINALANSGSVPFRLPFRLFFEAVDYKTVCGE